MHNDNALVLICGALGHEFDRMLIRCKICGGFIRYYECLECGLEMNEAQAIQHIHINIVPVVVPPSKPRRWRSKKRG